MKQERARVVVRLGAQPEQVYLLDADQTSLGRDSANDIIMGDYEVSRRHARILYRDGSYRVEDLGSTNGTFVNGYRLAGQVQLVDGDTIELGQSVSITFLWAEASETAEPDSAEAVPVVPESPKDDGPEHAAAVGTELVVEEPEVVAPANGAVDAAPVSAEAAPPDSQPPDPQPADPAPVAAAAAAPVAVAAEAEPELLAIPKFDPLEYARSNFQTVAEEVEEPEIDAPRGCLRYAAGLGCVVVALAIGFVLLFFLLDAFASDFLYCGPLRSLWDSLNPILNLFDRQNVCP